MESGRLGGAGIGPRAGHDLDGARLIALNMALNGAPRATTDRYLAEHYELADTQDHWDYRPGLKKDIGNDEIQKRAPELIRGRIVPPRAAASLAWHGRLRWWNVGPAIGGPGGAMRWTGPCSFSMEFR